jgi:RNA polymerase sigma-70 factor (ECF subfamily)
MTWPRVETAPRSGVTGTDDGSEFERARQAAEERGLVESARLGSTAAFEKLYRNHVGKIYGLCLRMTAHPATAEDCTQEVFIQAWRSLPAFQSRSAFGTWLHRIAVNAVLAQGRRRSEELGQAASADELAATRPDPSVGDVGTAMDLEQAIAGLPAGARQVLVLVGLYGYTHEEAAAMLGLAVGTCKSQLHRARQLLGERLALPEETP